MTFKRSAKVRMYPVLLKAKIVTSYNKVNFFKNVKMLQKLIDVIKQVKMTAFD